jgi:hypothetical protein
MKKQDAKLKMMYPIIYPNLYNAHKNIQMQQKKYQKDMEAWRHYCLGHQIWDHG